MKAKVRRKTGNAIDVLARRRASREDKGTRRQGDKEKSLQATPASPCLQVSRSPCLPVSLLPHPFAELLPLMSDAEFASLKSDLAVNPQTDDIMLFDGKILDGRNRYRALNELGKTPRTKEFKGTEAEALSYVCSKATHRNMSESQKATATVHFLPILEKQGKSRMEWGGVANLPQGVEQKLVSGKTRAQMRAKLNQTGRKELNRQYDLHIGWLGGDINSLITGDMVDAILDRMYGPEVAIKGKSRDIAGGLFGCSGRMVQDAKMLFDADPKRFREVFEGRLPLYQAVRQVKSHTRATHLAKKAATAPVVAEAEIITGDCLVEMEKMAARTFRLIFADPKYNIGIDYGNGAEADQLTPPEYCALTEKWISECRRLLTTDGSLWVVICDEWAGEYACILKKAGFRIRNWVKWYETFGVNCQNSFNRTSRHLFYCVKDPLPGGTVPVFNADVFNRPSDRQTKYQDKRAAAGGKIWDDVWTHIPRLVENSPEVVTGFKTQLPLALVDPIVRGCSEPGDHVFDPFTGSGTTAVAAALSGRKFTGTEIDPARAKAATMRLRAAVAEAKRV